MARTREDARTLWRCIEPFTIWPKGTPVLFNEESEVFDDDPILRTHRNHFEPATERVIRRGRAGAQTSAAPVSRAPVQPDPEEIPNG